MEQDIAAQVVGLGGATDFTLWNLFLRADFVVKFVIILLIACSIFSWALIFDKFKLFKKINNSIEDFEKKFWKAKSAESFNNHLPVNSQDPAVLIFKSAMTELLKTKRQSSAIQAARVERILEIATDNELKAMFNWQNDAQIKVYTATINNKKMAQQAIDKLNNERKKVKSV